MPPTALLTFSCKLLLPFCAHITSLDHTLLSTSVCPSVCLSVKRVYCDKTKAYSEKSSIMTNRKSPTNFPMSQRWTAYVALNPAIRLLWKFQFARWRRLMYLWSNAHHNYMPDFTPAFRPSVCHIRDPRLNGLISKCLLHVRCALSVRSSGPSCQKLLSEDLTGPIFRLHLTVKTPCHPLILLTSSEFRGISTIIFEFQDFSG